MPCLVFDIQNLAPERVEETLVVYDDGRCVLEVTAALMPALRSQAGTFAAGPDPRIGRQANRLAQALTGLNFAGKPFRRAVQWNVTARSGAVTRSYLLSVTDETPLPAVLQEASGYFTDWKERALEEPFAVVQIAANLDGPRSAPRLTLLCHARGSQAACFLLAPDSLTLLLEEAGGQREVWRAHYRLPAGLEDQHRQQVDGIHAPARLAPGSQAALVLPLPGPMPEGKLHLTCAGFIALANPCPPVSDFPHSPIMLACSVTR